MKIVKYLTLILLLWGIPSFFSYDESIGSKFSFLTYGLLLVYYFLCSKSKLLFSFLILGLLYFVTSGLIYTHDAEDYIFDFVKYFILIIAGAELARHTTIKEFYVLLILGASSILLHALFFQDGYGRYSGLYLNPNGAGFVCIIGYCLSFNITAKSLKILGQFIFTLAGIITFSRTFIALWILVSIISVVSNRKNSLNFGLGLGAIILVLSFASFMQLNTVRFEAFESILSNNSSANTAVIEDDSRLDTWSQYYDMILNNPVFGNGYQVLSGLDESKQGVHNTFLMVIGESGILPFILIIGIYLFMLKNSIKYFKDEVHKFMLAIVLIAILMSMHNYFNNYLIVFTSMWLFVNITNKHSQEIENKYSFTPQI